jgi:hypothetical protein
MNIHETIKNIIEYTLKDCVFLTKVGADNKVIDILSILIDNGKFRLESSMEGTTYSGTVYYQLPRQYEFKCISFVLRGESCSFSDTDKVKPFNFDIVNRPLKQLGVMVDGLLIYNQVGGYISLEKLHEDLADLNYFMKKVNAAAKYEPK